VTDMTNTRPRRLVQLGLPVETIEVIDSLADSETISRSAWIRRLVIGAAKGLSEKVRAAGEQHETI
jgi:hypothetical protein